MQALLAIARLTVKAAFRYRLVRVLGALLAGGVLLLPAVIKDDGTARGLTQIVLTYTLGLITAVLGLATLWTACGTLARDVEECQIQMVAVKPVARWQIWLGKWIGIMLLNALLLGSASGIVYAQMLWRARSLTPQQQEVLRNEIFVARGSAKQPTPELEPEVDRLLQERLKNQAVAQMERGAVRKIIQAQVQARLEVVPPGMWRYWEIDLSHAKDKLRDRFLFLRAKFFASERTSSETYLGIWEIGSPEALRRWRDTRSQAADSFQEFAIPPNLLDGQGILTVGFFNQNQMALLFPLEDGLEVLYPEGEFGLNYVRGVLILFCWLALLAALGLAAASFLSFPVAAFLSLGVLVLSFSTGIMSEVIQQGTIREVDHDTGMVDQQNWFDHATVAVFRGLLATVKLVRDFSPVDSLSSGRTITWGQLAQAVSQIVLLMGGLFALVGIVTFGRRELATAEAKT
jgi:hypothetical protein